MITSVASEISRIVVKDFKLTSSGGNAVFYTLLVTGFTALLHPAAFFEERTGKFNPMPSFIVRLRYSEIRKMHKRLKAEWKGVKLPPFPPKKWIGSKNEAFLLRRMESLNIYYKRLLLIRNMPQSAVILTSLRPTKTVDLVLRSAVPANTCDFIANCLKYTPCAAPIPAEYTEFIAARKRAIESAEDLPEVDMILDGELVRVKCTVKKNVPLDQAPPTPDTPEICTTPKAEFVMTLNNTDSMSLPPPPYTPKSAPGSHFGSFASSDSPEPSFLTFRQILKSTNCSV